MGSVSSDRHHIVLFPFMSKGHIIPILHLAHLLLRRPQITVTVFTTPANRPFIAKFLSKTTASIIDIPYPETVPEIPNGVESTDKLPSMSLYVPFTRATKLMQPAFERALQGLHPRVSFMVSDAFLWWTLESATKFCFPRFVFYGMNNYAMCVSKSIGQNQLLSGVESDDELNLITVPDFPWIKITRNDFDPPIGGPGFDLFTDQIVSASNSYGMIVNSFYELEPLFADHWNSEAKPKAWCVGPLCLVEPPKNEQETEKKLPTWIQWLDQKLEEGRSVIYIAFGSQAEITNQQLKEIAMGLEKSEANFLWVIRKEETELGDGFEERVKERGIVVREWVDQKEILRHRCVKGFLSHCGWNSALESICAGVPILAWPMMADQPLNARMITEEVKVGLRVETCSDGFVKWEGLEKMVRELMEGENGEKVRKNVKELSQVAKEAMEEGKGLSWLCLDMLISETCKLEQHVSPI